MHLATRLRGGVLALAITVALAASPSLAAAMTGPPSGLSPRLARLASGSLRSAPPSEQAAAVGLVSSGPGGLLRHGRRLVVYVRFDHGVRAALPAVRAAGGQIVDDSARYQTATVAVKAADLRRLAAVRNVAAVTEARTPFTAATCPSGKVVSEGVQQLDAGEGTGEARKEFPVDGTGITVGILSDSFDQATEAADGSGAVATHAKEDEESGDVPGPKSPCANKEKVSVLEPFVPESPGEAPFDEGRGMAQIVHDVAPGAKIDFASAFNGEEAFASNIEELSSAGAKIIADDVFYLEEPFFQDGPVAVAAGEAVKSGAAFFSAAGNDNIIDQSGNDVASWETPEFRDAGSCPPEVERLAEANAKHCLDFNPGAGVDKTFGVKVEPGGILTVDLQWDEPWNGVETDLDAFLLNSSGRLIEAAGEDNIGGSQEPSEFLQWENASVSTKTVQLVVNRFAGKSPRLKFGLLENGAGVEATEYPRSTGEDVVGPTIFGHSGSAGAVSVGAIRFNTKSAPEEFSSRGPVRHDFGPVKGTKKAAPLGSPEILSKPDLVATDCGLTTFFAEFVSGQGWRFCGTSAAAPHAAGVAALMLDEKSATPAQLLTALQASASKVGAFDPCSVGVGLIDATAAIEDLNSGTPASPEECELPTPGNPEEARAPGEWGSEVPPAETSTVVPPPPPPPPLPRTSIRKKPPHVVRTRSRTARVVFVFGSDQAGVTFACRIDTGLFKPCPARLVRRFPVGSHMLRVFARNASGSGDPTPAVYRFRVKRVG